MLADETFRDDWQRRGKRDERGELGIPAWVPLWAARRSMGTPSKESQRCHTGRHSEQTEEDSAGGDPGCGSLGELVGAKEELLCGTGGCQHGFNRFLESYFL